MRSPFTQHELRPLEGNPTVIWDDGDGFVKLAVTMSETACRNDSGGSPRSAERWSSLT